MHDGKDTGTKHNILVNAIFAVVVFYLLSLCLCLVYSKEIQAIIAHSTGILTMAFQVIVMAAGAFLWKYFKDFKSIRLYFICSFFSGFLMFIGYFMYLFLHISPSLLTEKLHAFSSVLLDLASVLYPISCLLGINVIIFIIRDNK